MATRITETRGETICEYVCASLNINILEDNYDYTAFRTVFGRSGTEHTGCSLDAMDDELQILKDDRQRFLQKVSKKQFRTVYYNANACG